LLDTCALIFWAVNPDVLTEEARIAIGDGRSFVYVSAATAMEIAIKYKIGKLDVPTDVSELLRVNRFEPLSISIEHGQAMCDLPLHHKDPFDRVLIAQAHLEKLMLSTRDKEIVKYDVPILAA